MNLFFTFLELAAYAFVVYIAFSKKDLVILYLPILFFVDTVISAHFFSAFVYYGTVSALLIYTISQNTSFMRSNVFAIVLIVYFAVLMGKSEDLGKIRQDLFNVMWFFVSIPLIPIILKKYSRDIVFKELALSACIIMIIFSLNTALSTIFKFDVHSMYGITSGIIYGNLFATDFNIISIAIFIVLLRALNTKNIFYMIVCLVALTLIGLSLRRSVIGLSSFGVVIVMLLFFLQNIKHAMIFGILAVVIGGAILIKTNFISTFKERYDLRQLDERSLEEEKRLFEYELLYHDMFVRQRYSPWFGFGLFNSPGNYGDGRFYDRSLHSDLTSIIHSGGIIAALIYLFMITTAFLQAIKAASTKTDILLILFCIVAFVAYTLTGRFTQVGCMFLLVLVLNIPFTNYAYETEDEEEEEGQLIMA